MCKHVFAPQRLLSYASVDALILVSGAVASAQELPTYGVNGFPATPLQLSVLDTAHVKELAPATTLTMDGMPASPNQIAVLSEAAGLIGIKGDVVTPAIAKLLTKQTVQVMKRLHKVSLSPEVND